MADRVGQQLGNYRLLRLLGVGGFAEVYLGEHIYLKTQAAIKVLHTRLAKNDLEDFLSEARTIANLEHPHIVRVLEFGVDGDIPFLVMSYAPNGTLRDRHSRGTKVAFTTVVSYIKQVADALQYAHDEKLIHRDVKPENMLIGRRNEILLSDFGIALIAQSSRYQSTQDVVGTVAYMSPEQIQGKPRPASDQYSLAIVTYEWISGDRPFHGSFTELCAQHMFASPPSLRERAPEISFQVEQVILKALAKEPHQRFENVQTFAGALVQANQSERSPFTVPQLGNQSGIPPTQPAFVLQQPGNQYQSGTPPTQPASVSRNSDVRPPYYEKHSAVMDIPSVASDTIFSPEEQGLEKHGIERVSPKTRTHVRIRDNFTMWLAANLVISTIALGAIANLVFGLGFWDGLAVIIIFNILGVLPVAFFSTLGPKLGLRQMTITRFAFGWVGGIIMALFNVAACIGWSTVNVIIGGQLVNSLTKGAVPVWLGILVIAILTTVVSIYGYRYVHRYERWAWIPMAIIFVVAVPHMKIIPTPAFGAAEIAGFISFGGAIYGFATGWSSYAADYNVNQPEDTPAARIFWLTFLGVFIPCVLLETLGMVFTSWIPKSGGDLLAGVAAPLGGFGTFLVALLALSTVAYNIPNNYSLGLSMQVLGKWFMAVPRYVWTLIGAVVYIALAVALVANGGNFNETLDSFMLLVAYWLGPYAIILIIEHFVYRRGRYNVDDWNTRSRLPVGWAAIISMAIGLFGAYLGFAQVIVFGGNVKPVIGPIGDLISQPYGMDVGFELAIIFAGIAYLILRRIELNTSH